MDDQPAPSMSSQAWQWTLVSLGHLGGVTLIASGIALLVLPLSTIKLVLSAHRVAPMMIQRSMASILLHIGLSACIWALGVILYKLWKRPRPQVIHRLGQRGSVMTETLVVLPVFMLLSFGMAQLAVNNIGGILANVAVYEAARAAWVWQPEVDVTRVTKVTDSIVENRVRIAAAMVMLPVAPGDFEVDSVDDDTFKSAREALALGQMPWGMLAGGESIVNFVGGLNTKKAYQNNLSVARALDESSFLARTVRKFTGAYQATTVDISERQANESDQGSGNRTVVELTFKLQQAMPLTGRVFGELETIGGRKGYYNTYTRTYSFRTQPFKPNPNLPNGVGNEVEEAEAIDDTDLTAEGATQNAPDEGY